MTPVEILKAARELIAKPERWTRGVRAKNQHWFCVDPSSDDACCWCAIGAIHGFWNDENTQLIDEACRALSAGTARPGEPFSVAEFNDSHDHAEVLALFDRAIASAQP